MPDDKNLDDLSIDEINELFNSVIEGPEEWVAGNISNVPSLTEKSESMYCAGLGMCGTP